jgi:hypothetical protein
VFDGKVDPPVADVKATPYVLARFVEVLPDLNFLGVTHVYALRITVHCVGGNDRAARQMADLAKGALQDVTPTVSGRKCFPIRWDDGSEQPPDEATGVTVADQVVVFLMRSVPAP